MSEHYDVIIIGGSYAGLSAALALGRALREVLVIDGGRPCNRQTPHSHNFLTQDGNTPAGISALGKDQLLKYPTIRFKEGEVNTVKGENNHFEVVIEQGQLFYAKKLLFATGLNDLQPAIPGFAACWGISVIHCPYCHGYEYKNQSTGILMNGEQTLEMAKLIRNWTDRLIVFTNGKAALSSEQLQGLQEMGIKVMEGPLLELVHENGRLKQLLFEDGDHLPLDVLYARPPFEQQCMIPEYLGCKITAAGHIDVDDFQKTSIAGIYAAGDNAGAMRSVSSAVYSGNKAGAVINHDLIAEKVWNTRG